MQDVANRAGVSIQTVSNLVNGREHLMSKKTRERVAQAMTVLEYRPNMRARGLRAAKTNEIGFLVVDDEARFLADPMNGTAMAGAGEMIRGRGFGMLIESAKLGEVDDGLFAPLLQSRADGGILYLSGPPGDREVYVRRIVELGYPYVLFGEAREDGLPAVAAENETGSHELATHLIEKGHRRIGFIAGRAAWPMIEQRFAGYRRALQDAGIEPDPSLQLFRGRWNPADGAAMAHSLLALPDPPTAIMAGNDVLALGIFEAARDRGLRIPDDVAVTGFNDFEFAAFLQPALTTVALPVWEMGEAAAEIVIDQIQRKDRPRVRQFPVDVLIRGSS